MVCCLPARHSCLAWYCVLFLCFKAWPAAETPRSRPHHRRVTEDLSKLHREQRLLSQQYQSDDRNDTADLSETTTPHNSTISTSTSITSITTATATEIHTTTQTSTMTTMTGDSPEVRMVGTIALMVMNAYAFAENEFSTAAVIYGLSRWATVDVSEVRAAIETEERRLLDVRRLQASSTKAMLKFSIHVIRSRRLQAETEFDRLSALIANVQIASLTSELRYSMMSLGISLPLRAVSLDGNVSLIIPGEGAVRYGPTTTLPGNSSSEQAQVQDLQDRASGVENLLALWSIIAYYSLRQP